MDFLPTKGIEYLLAIGYLLILVTAWLLMRRTALAGATVRGAGPLGLGRFPVPAGTHFHRGHAWARVGDDGMLEVGVDDFTSAVTGTPDEIALPGVGTTLSQGVRGWIIRRGDRQIPMLAPVDGEVVAVNDRSVHHPATITADPYGEGWLLKVKPADLRANLASLFNGGLARRWMQETYDRLSSFFSPELGVVMQDGGTLVDGIIESVELRRTPEFVREFFLVEVDTAAT